jgi:hypothetical protein
MSRNCIERVIIENNLSVAWGKAFLEALNPRKDLTPLVVMVRDFESGDVREDAIIRDLLETALESMGKQSCNTVANTIFPQSLWNSRKPRTRLYERYLRILPEIRKCPKNKYGVYFERLIDFCGAGGDNGKKGNNQLEHLIQTWTTGNHRRSALQAAIFDPRRDHTNQRQRGFPCLQHVTFTVYGDQRRLAVNGFYATQYLFERAYGNYLGLCRLGEFVAHELNLEFAEMNCTVGIGILDVSNQDVADLVDGLRNRIGELKEAKNGEGKGQSL